MSTITEREELNQTIDPASLSLTIKQLTATNWRLYSVKISGCNWHDIHKVNSYSTPPGVDRIPVIIKAISSTVTPAIYLTAGEIGENWTPLCGVRRRLWWRPRDGAERGPGDTVAGLPAC